MYICREREREKYVSASCILWGALALGRRSISTPCGRGGEERYGCRRETRT